MRQFRSLLLVIVCLSLVSALHGQPANPSEEELKLMTEKLQAAQKELQEIERMSRDVKFDITSVLPAYLRCVEAGLELHQKQADREKLLEDLVKTAKEIEKTAKDRLKGGAGLPRDLCVLQYMRSDAELRLLREKKKGK